MLIPLRIKAWDLDGGHGDEAERLVLLDRPELAVPLGAYRSRPMLSINRGFSAPVIIDFAREEGELAWLAAHAEQSGRPLQNGDIIMTGSLIVTQFPTLGEQVEAEIEGFGTARVRFD